MKFIRKRKIESKEAIQKSVTQVSFALMHYIAKMVRHTLETSRILESYALMG